MLSKVTATVCFNVINGYTAELFPTSLRNTAIGLCVMAARSGASIIPEINLLVEYIFYLCALFNPATRQTNIFLK